MSYYYEKTPVPTKRLLIKFYDSLVLKGNYKLGAGETAQQVRVLVAQL